MSVVERERVTHQDVLQNAADLILERGWCQHNMHGANGGLCALGAIFAAGWLPGLSGDEIHDLVKRVEEGLPGKQSLPFWNDRPERTKEDVVALLREAATA